MLLTWVTVVLFCMSGNAENEPGPPLINNFQTEIIFRGAVSDDDTTFFTLKCHVYDRTNPAPQFRWTKNGENFDWKSESGRIVEQFEDDSKIQILTFNRPKPSDAGVYQCFARNEFGLSQGNPVNVTKGELLNIHVETQVSAKIHHSIKFECDIPDAFIKESIIWKRLKMNNDGKTHAVYVSNDNDHKTDSNGNLIFTRVSHTDDSFKNSNSPYYCTYKSMSNGNKISTGSKIYLSVIDDVTEPFELAPYPLHISPKNIDVFQRDFFTLYCVHGGYPRPNITWTINGTEYDSFRDSVFMEAPRNESNVDTYACHVTNGIGSALTHIFEVNVKPNIYWNMLSFDNSESETMEGDTTQVFCTSNNNPLAKKEWFINTILITNVSLDDRWSVTSDKIVLSNVQPSDMSVIGCKVTLGDISIYNENDLRVTSKAPFFEEDQEKLTWYVGDTKDIRCLWEAGPTPEVQWLKYGQKIEINGRVHYTNELLVIKNIAETDAGIYECIASNKYGSASFKAVATVYKKTKILNKIQNEKAKIGSTVIFPCNVEKDEKLINVYVEWRHKHNKIVLDVDHVVQDDYSLKITNIKTSDAGDYFCMVRQYASILARSEKGNLIVNLEDN